MELRRSETLSTAASTSHRRVRHGEWTFAGADYKRRATKWRCPTGECAPSRGAVEREFGRLKHEWALAPLRVGRLDRVRLHADLTILAKLATALSRARAVTVSQ